MRPDRGRTFAAQTDGVAHHDLGGNLVWAGDPAEVLLQPPQEAAQVAPVAPEGVLGAIPVAPQVLQEIPDGARHVFPHHRRDSRLGLIGYIPHLRPPSRPLALRPHSGPVAGRQGRIAQAPQNVNKLFPQALTVHPGYGISTLEARAWQT